MLEDSVRLWSLPTGGYVAATVKVLYHDRCFDGACSASLFTRFYRECVGADAQFQYQGLMHKAGGGGLDPADFSADENAVVDFKYAQSPKLTWWFDHHLSAFLTPEDEAAFRGYEQEVSEGRVGRQQQFFDPNYISCTKLIADVARERFGMKTEPLTELIHWANIVDGAKYDSAEAAVGMREPAMQLTLAIENAPSSEFGQRLIPLLTEMPLDAIVREGFVAEALGPLLAQHHESIELLRDRAFVQGGVLTYDLTDEPVEALNKFIPYFLHPEATYVVGLSKSSYRVKISVGTNPWTTIPAKDLMNIATICERYGGGGHARVGAVSYGPDQEEAARDAAGEIIGELRGGGEAAG